MGGKRRERERGREGGGRFCYKRGGGNVRPWKRYPGYFVDMIVSKYMSRLSAGSSLGGPGLELGASGIVGLEG